MNLEDNIDIDRYREAIESIAQSKSDLKVNTDGKVHASIVVSKIFQHSQSTVRILAGNFMGEVAEHPEYLTALNNFLSKGKRLEVLLESYPDVKNSMAFNIISKISALGRSNVSVRLISNEAQYRLKQTFGDKQIHFVVGDECMYRVESDTTSFRSLSCFNDPNTAKKFVDVFDKDFYSCEEVAQEIYNDRSFNRTCAIVIPDFENINLELIEYFSRNPDALQNLNWRNFEKLLDEIFKNQGFQTELGPGSGDEGVDLRLIQKDSVGQILTLVQAKKYKKENPIRLEAVQALTAIVERENANRGLFVTTSRYLPGVEKWASEQPTRIILAKSEDVAKWCLKISQDKM